MLVGQRPPVCESRLLVARPRRLAQRWLALAVLVGLLLVACSGPPPPVPAPTTGPVSEDAAHAPRPFAWRQEGGAWESCTVVVRAQRPLAEDDADELEAVLTDWYNLGRLGAFKDDPGQPGRGAAETMDDPWQPAPDTLA